MSPDKKNKKKSTVKAPSKKVAKNTPAQSGGGNGPFYVLVIIILVTVIVLLLNKFYENGRLTIPYMKITGEKNKPVAEKGEKSKDKSSEDKSVHSGDKEKNDKYAEKTDKSDEKKPDDKTSAAEKDVSLFFLKLDEKSEKIYLSSVKRKLSGKQILSLTLEQLIKGPSPYEKKKGYISAIPANLKIRGIEIKGKTAEIDFNGAIEEGAAGDILLKRIQQIVQTATQFEDVESILIKINGQKRKTIGSDGFSIGGPLRR